MTLDPRLAADASALSAGRMSRAEFVRRGIAAGVSVSVIGSVLAACGGGNGSGKSGATSGLEFGTPRPVGEPPSSPTGTLVFGNAEPPSRAYWDPASSYGLADEQVASLVFDSLMVIDADGEAKPHLASGVEHLDARTTRVSLREGVRFHDGTPLTAEDVKASFERLGAKGSTLVQSGIVAPLHCVVRSPTSVDIVFDEPFGPVDTALTAVKILPKADVAKPSNFEKRGLGSGPYKFVSYQGNTVTLRANADYWGGAPHIKTIRFDFIGDADARRNALLTGDIQVMTRCGPVDLNRIRGNDRFYATNVSPPSQFVYVLSHGGPFKDLDLRRAAMHAIDRQAISAGIWRGLFPVAKSSMAATTPMFQPKPQYAFDPEKARGLLRGRKVNLRLASSTITPNHGEVDQAVAQYLREAGFNVALTKLEAGTYRSTFTEYDIILGAIANLTADPDFTLQLYTGATGKVLFKVEDPKADKLVAAQRATDPSARPAKVDEAAGYLWQQVTGAYLCDEIWYSIVSSRVQNYTRAPIVGERLATKAWLS